MVSVLGWLGVLGSWVAVFPLSVHLSLSLSLFAIALWKYHFVLRASVLMPLFGPSSLTSSQSVADAQGTRIFVALARIR